MSSPANEWRDPRFAELDRLIALDDSAALELAPPSILTPRLMWHVKEAARRRPCFICGVRRRCPHREPGVEIAIAERVKNKQITHDHN